mgnify:CR=1 FL=1
MELMEKIKAECKKHEKCNECPFVDGYEVCSIAQYPEHWNIEAIRKALKEKENVRGHWILEREYDGKPNCYHCSVCDMDGSFVGIKVASHYCPNCGAEMDNEHILETEAIRKALGETSDKASDKEEIVVPKKWGRIIHQYGTEEGEIKEKQNEIIECLEQIKERLK